MNRVHTRKPFQHAASVRLPRMAVVSGGLLAVAATVGLVVSQADGSQPAQASGSVVAAAAPRAGVTQAPQGGATGAVPAAPVPPSKVLDYAFQLQPNYYYCGPAATRIALSASGHILSQDEIARQLGTTTGGTNSAYDTTRALNNVIGSNVYQTREIPAYPATPAQMDQLQADVLKTVNSGRAIVANIAGHLTDTAGTYHSYEGGHYLTIIGYKDDGRTVKIADPANPNGDGTYWVTTINMANWISQRGYSY
ncbi:C39 family peptidase [Planosporangium sp. 12N6]|uniref:C39 family peptidase n=1 Tax=Planosporangium spinosum TaxID=3402278 RepID=UPI003CF93953